MNIERFPEPIDALIIKNTFSEVERNNIENEIKSFKREQGDGVWISDVYKDLEMSPVNRNMLETFFGPDVFETMVNMNSLYGIYGHVNNHSTIVRYYGDGQSSVIHYDAAAFTIKTFLFDQPKGFTGGNVTLQVGGDIAYESDIENNMSIIFPSSYYVSLSDVSITDKSIKDSGLFVITTYLFIESH